MLQNLSQEQDQLQLTLLHLWHVTSSVTPFSVIITKHAYGERGPTISTEARQALQLFHQLILMDVPREVSLRSGQTWYIFTDACYEPQDARGSAGIGAVIVDQLGRYRGFLSTFLTEDLLAKLNITKRKTIIFECELLAIFCGNDMLV